MSDAKEGDTIKVHYKGTLEDGTVFDSSRDDEPLEFTLGKGQIIKGFENAVLGMSIGETKTVRIPSNEAYGPRMDELLLKFNKTDFPPDIEPIEGLILDLRNPDGRTLVARIIEVSGDLVTLDANHPMAGKDLTFKIDLMEIA
ncbi:MAG: peptidylprolyl isomerase [Thermodesulfovibrio sp. RBG_19FT_COMBO_42_12]|nr:MAG: peptidylprolyl isomerase [Thermodesulfovibrio sp. RBG_19FT_COMBO_42_12]